MCKNPQTLLSQVPEGEDSRRRACPGSVLPVWKARRSRWPGRRFPHGGRAAASVCGPATHPGSPGSALPAFRPAALNLAALMPRLVCSPSPSCFLKPTPLPRGWQAAGRKWGCGCVPRPGWLSTDPWHRRAGTCEGWGCDWATIPWHPAQKRLPRENGWSRTSRDDPSGTLLQAPKTRGRDRVSRSHTCGDKHTRRAGSSPWGRDCCLLASPPLRQGLSVSQRH